VGYNFGQVKFFTFNTPSWNAPQLCYSIVFFTITAEIFARSLANFYCQYAQRHARLKLHSILSEIVSLVPPR